jgi:hypothetical protein
MDTGRATADRFRTEARAALLKGRALEAAHCPEIADAIMCNSPVTDEEKQQVRTEFDARMFKAWSTLNEQQKWQAEHPQCKHVERTGPGGWSSTGGASGTIPGSPEDLSGNFKGKKGQCSVLGTGPIWRGSEDSLAAYSPDTNPRLAQLACQDAMTKFGFDGPADPKQCELQ